jgi:FkbM family methyltransferase
VMSVSGAAESRSEKGVPAVRNEPRAQERIRPQDSNLNQLGKRLARPLSRLAASPLLLPPTRYALAYLNVLIGNGSGTGWDLAGEVDAALSVTPNMEPLVFDVGANTGEWTRLLLAQRPDAHVMLFEPAVGCHAHLRPLLSERVRLVPSAVGATSGMIQLWSAAETDAGASVHPRGDSLYEGQHVVATEVPIVTLDDFIASHGFSRIDFVKFDIEGHECAALRGAEKSLREQKIRALAFEFGIANVNSRTFLRDFWELLHPLGYQIARITPGGRLVSVRSYYEDLEYFRGVSNYVAVLGDCR